LTLTHGRPSAGRRGWDGEGPLRIRGYDLLVYLWYELPTKYVAPLDARRAVAAALAALLDHLFADERQRGRARRWLAEHGLQSIGRRYG
jgi:hypothetical protein